MSLFPMCTEIISGLCVILLLIGESLVYTNKTAASSKKRMVISSLASRRWRLKKVVILPGKFEVHFNLARNNWFAICFFRIYCGFR